MDKYNWKKVFPQPPNSFHQKVSATLLQLPEKEEYFNMKSRKVRKKMSFRRVAVFALVAMLAVGTTAYAAGKIATIVCSGSSTPTYTTMPTSAELDKEFGFQPKLIDTFENGYKFETGSKVSVQGLDEDDNVINKSKQLNIAYIKDKTDVVLCMNNFLNENSQNSSAVDTYGGSDLYFSEYTAKNVPPDYVMTEQDKTDSDSGKYVFSVGSEKVTVEHCQFLSWQDDKTNYQFVAIGSNLTQKDLITMAHEVIDTK